jgi:hypothetical protein
VMITGPLDVHTRPSTLTHCYMVAPDSTPPEVRARLKYMDVP